MKEQILEDFKKNSKIYDAFRERVLHLLKDLLSEQEIQIHQISSRNKTFESLSKKISDKNEKYNCIDDITDIVGIRIITYLESEVDSISELIEKEFIKDDKNSIDKRKLKSDQFGYRSLHIVASFNTDRCNLKEYKRYKGIKCEIQIRSILQHAWAEIEHDLGYKGEISIPEPYKRTFNRLSALLETADIEFDRLKAELASYELKVPQLIESEPEFVDINSASISSFIDSNEILLLAKEITEERIGIPLKKSKIDDDFIRIINYFEFDSIGELEKSLIENKSIYLNFVKIFVNEHIKVGREIFTIAPLMYFLHYLASKPQNITFAKEYFIFGGFSGTSDESIQKYLDIYKKSING